MISMCDKFLTIVAISTAEGLKWQLNFLPEFIDVDSVGYSWGLPLAWKFDSEEEAIDAKKHLNPFFETMVNAIKAGEAD